MQTEVQRVQADRSNPIGQRGATPIRRPPSMPAPDASAPSPGREAPLTRAYQAEQGYGYAPKPESQEPVDPRSGDLPHRSPAEAASPEPAAPEADPGREPEFRPDEWAQRYAQIQRRERQVHQEKQEIKRQRAELEQREARVREYEETVALREKDPKAFIEKNGLSYEKLTDVYLNDGKPTPEQQIAALQAQIQSLIDGRAEEKEEQKKSSTQEKIEGFKRNIMGVIDQTEGERFELIKAQKQHDLVFEVIQNYWQETGEMLPIAEAADFVETELFNDAQQLMGLSKFKPRMQQPAPAPEPELPPAPTQRPPEPQRNPPRQTIPGRSQTLVRDPGGINNLSYAQQTRKEAARMLFNR